MAGFKCPNEGIFINQSAAGAINNPNASLRFLEMSSVKQMACLVSQGRVKRNKIRAGKQIVEFIHQLDLQTSRARSGKIRIKGKDTHTEGDGAPAQLTADASHTDDAEHLVVKFYSLKIGSAPASAADTRIC